MKKSIILLMLLSSVPFTTAPRAELRVGIVGLDSSHCVNWTPYLNDPDNADFIPGARVVAAYPGGSPDVVASYTRVERFTNEMVERFGVELTSSIEELCDKVDAVMILSVDGRAHLPQARIVIAAGKPLFIDKPLAANLREALEIYEVAEAAGVPVFSSSSHRVSHAGAAGLDPREIGEIKGAASHGQATLEPNHQDLFWYGIHAVEGLFTYLGAGCESVARVATDDTDLAVGVWSGGRVGTVRGIRDAARSPRVTVYGTRGILDQAPGAGGRAALVAAIVHFFQTGEAPVTPEETLEIIAFMEAADISKRRGGCEVSIQDVFEAARGTITLADGVY